MFFARLLPLLFFVYGATTEGSSPAIQILDSFQKNFNTFLTSRVENEKKAALHDIHAQFTHYDDFWNRKNYADHMVCGVTNESCPYLVQFYPAYVTCGSGLHDVTTSGTYREEEVGNSGVMKVLIGMKPTSIESAGPINIEFDSAEKISVGTKWAFKQDWRRMDCGVAIDYNKIKKGVEKILVVCHSCHIW